jgi:hypothetical protein
MAFQSGAFQFGAFQGRALNSLLDVSIEMALGGSYRKEVVVDAPLAYWRLNSTIGSVPSPRDSIQSVASGGGYHGVHSGSGTVLNASAMHAEAPRCFSFVGGAFIALTSGTDALTAFDFTTMSLEFWIRKTGTTAFAQFVVANFNVTSPAGWYVQIETNGKVLFAMRNALNTADDFALFSAGSVTDGYPHHVVCTWTGTTATNGVKIYVDGVLSSQATSAGTGSTPTGHYATIAAAHNASGTALLTGALSDVAFYNTVLSATRIAAHYTSGLWTDITDDLIDSSGLRTSFGIKGGSPVDRVPEVGIADFYLRNDAGSTGGQSYYSPNHPNVREGFRYGTLTRIRYTQTGDTPRQRFLGRITAIDPEPGVNGPRRTHVILSDLVDDLINTDLRNIVLQTNTTESVAIQRLIEALPITAQPLAMELDDAVDTIAYAFSDLASGARAAQPLADLVISSMGFGSIDEYGVFDYENRLRRQVSSPLYVIDNEFSRMNVPSTLAGVYNRFRLVTTQRTIDAAATRVLFSIPEATTTNPATISIAPGETQEYWGTYFDPNNVIRNLGGTAQVAPVATTDYLANALADGTGTDKTANITLTAETFVTTVKFVITNNDAATVYMKRMQLRGKGLFEEGKISVEESSPQSYGDRAHPEIYLPYQSNPNNARDLAQFLLAQFENSTFQPGTVDLIAHTSLDMMDLVLQGHLGDRFTLRETVTGTNNDAFIHNIATEIKEGRFLTATIHFSTAAFADEFWILQDADSSLGDNTSLGFG